MFKVRDNPGPSDFGRYPRSLQEAFKGIDYGCAIEAPTPAKKWLKRALEAFPRLIWISSIVVVILILWSAV